MTDLGKMICAIVEAISTTLLQPNSFMNKTAAYTLTGCLQLGLPPRASHAGPFGARVYELGNSISAGI